MPPWLSSVAVPITLVAAGGTITLLVLWLTFVGPFAEPPVNLLRSIRWMGLGVVLALMGLSVWFLYPLGSAFKPRG